MLPLVTVIINTRNEEKHIKACLESVFSQTYPQKYLEVILVDNYSDDRTFSLARQFPIKLYRQGPERSSQKNFAVQKSSGQYLLFLDADMLCSATLVSRAVAYVVKNPFTVALYLPEFILGSSYFCQVRRLERSFYNGTVVDGLRFFQKAVFVKSGGFDPQLFSFEDWDLDKKIKQLGSVALLADSDFTKIHLQLNKLNYHSSNWPKTIVNLTLSPVIFHNELSLSFISHLAKKQKYAQKGLEKYWLRWGKNNPETSPWYRGFWVFVEKAKWRQIVRYPHLFLGILFLKFLVGFIYLYYRFNNVRSLKR